ncbi:hypothetical protein WPS_33020 [Vulcanimicrobium alpinum]|uniref:TonB-dependent receptor-like beta-barrel domain-containing protein n=1 Tax=Vulcanimicrobium alpinum TaxID=3016050 RepID=A0AAN1XZ41_UNVUL|nr:TonB-dependent receptor [Vulcanimicrobium alpinum]BDE08026.1 hypothetical protein WPS_33020 [Vulcanimicrobium alpinum]
MTMRTTLDVLQSVRVPIVAIVLALSASGRAVAADATTGMIVGRVVGAQGRAPVPGTEIVAASAAGRYRARGGSDGRFTLVGVTPDTYTVTISANGFAPLIVAALTVPPGASVRVDAALVPSLREIGRVGARPAPDGVEFERTEDVFHVGGERARGLAAASSSGLGTYTQGTVQAAVAAVPGVQQDQFANVILQGGKVQDTVFSFDGVPVPQALIAEPGGNVVGAQLATTGTRWTTVTTGGFSGSSNQGLSGVIDQIPATGGFPAVTTVEIGTGVSTNARSVEVESRWATPTLRQRYALDVRAANEQIAYGDGHTFYPAEAGTYGLALAHRATWSAAGNAHVRVRRDDLSVSLLAGAAAYDQYATPFAGQTYGAFDGANGSYPGEPSPAAAVTTPSRVRGTYAVEKIADLRSYDHATMSLQLYGSQYGAHTAAPYFDDLSFPSGVVSYFGGQNSALFGAGLDVQNVASERHELRYGGDLRRQTSLIDQLVPTFDEHVTAQPVLGSYLAYASDRWTPSTGRSLTATLRATGTRVVRSDGNRYSVSALDPHLGFNLRLSGTLGVFASFDRTTQAPNPLETERNDAAAPARFAPLAPESGTTYEAALEQQGLLRARITYFAKSETNLVDVLPADFRSALAAGTRPSGVGIPTNAGSLRVRGLEFALSGGALTVSATYLRGMSSSAAQFGYSNLNAPAVAAGHRFPLGYAPDLSAVASYAARIGARITVTPSLSYQSGYPYGNGTKVWIFDPHTGRPAHVPNDNYVNRGYNYCFLRDPAKPYDAATNPYIGTLGTPEGDDPNTLRSTPRLLASLHVRAGLGRKAALVVDIVNLFADAAPTAYQGNPYLIGPPGYGGGDPAYAAAYGKAYNGAYALGNGVPTNDGRTPAVPWRYGTAGYVPSSYPNARAVTMRLQVQR